MIQSLLAAYFADGFFNLGMAFLLMKEEKMDSFLPPKVGLDWLESITGPAGLVEGAPVCDKGVGARSLASVVGWIATSYVGPRASPSLFRWLFVKSASGLASLASSALVVSSLSKD